MMKLTVAFHNSANISKIHGCHICFHSPHMLPKQMLLIAPYLIPFTLIPFHSPKLSVANVTPTSLINVPSMLLIQIIWNLDVQNWDS